MTARVTKYLALASALASAVEADGNVRRQALVMRHCVRSTADDVGATGTEFKNKEDFTAKPVAEYGVPENWCTPAGLQILEGSAAFLGESVFSRLPKGATLQLVGDSVQRNVDSVAALLRGFGTYPAQVSIVPALFDPTSPDAGSAICQLNVSDAALAEEVRERLTSVPMPGNFAEDLKELEELLGRGRAGSLTALPGMEVTDKGVLSGAANVMAAFGQDFLYTYASGLSYLNATVDQIYRYIAWKHWARSVQIFNERAAVQGAALLWAIERDMSLGTAALTPGATIYSGHDTNLDQLSVLLDLAGWAAPPYVGGAVFPTPPGSGLLFEREDDGEDGKVSISFLYPVFNGTDGKPSLNGALLETPVLSVTWTEFRDRVQKGLEKYPNAQACFKDTAPQGWPGVLAI